VRREFGDLVAQAIQLGGWLDGGTKVGILYTPIFERSWRLEDTRSRGDPEFFGGRPLSCVSAPVRAAGPESTAGGGPPRSLTVGAVKRNLS